jgi:hypothetical protein
VERRDALFDYQRFSSLRAEGEMKMHDYIANGTGRCGECGGERVIGEHTGIVRELPLKRYAVFVEGVHTPYFTRVASREIAQRFYESQGLRPMWIFQTENS